MTTTPAAHVSGTIKALEWVLASSPAGTWLSVSIAGDYVIRPARGSTEARLSTPTVSGWTRHRDVGAAKAAAQADYNARILAAIQPEPEPQPVAWLWLSAYGRVRSASNDPPDQGHLDTAQADGDRIIPVHANTSSAGTVSVEAAARVLLEACPNPIFDVLKPAIMGEIRETVWQTDEYGDEVSVDRQVPWDTMKTVIRAALRALAGEGGR